VAKFYTIYQTTNTVNGKVYVGKHITKDPNDDYLGSGKNIRRAVTKYGRDKFTKEVLHVFNSEDEMNLKEKELVTEEFCARKDTYNICEGGKGGFGFINTNRLNETPKKREASRLSIKIAKAAHTVWWNDPANQDRRAEIIASGQAALWEKYPNGIWVGKNHTAETKEKIGSANAISQSGVRNSQFGTVWITNGSLNKKVRSDAMLDAGWRRGRVKIRANAQIPV